MASKQPPRHHQPAAAACTWCVATTAANHMTGNYGTLTGYTPTTGGHAVSLPNKGSMPVRGRGSVNSPTVVLQDVWYVPGLDANMVSAPQLAKLGYKLNFGPHGCDIVGDRRHGLVGTARLTDDSQFEVEFLRVPPASTN